MHLRPIVALALCVSAIFAANEAGAVGIAGARLSNDPGEYHSAGEHAFDPTQNVYLYLDLQYGDPQGYQFWAECTLAVDATGEPLRRVSISDRTVYNDPVVRSSAINMAWPNAWVAVTCWAQGRSDSRTFRFNPALWVRGGGTSGAAAAPAPVAYNNTYAQPAPQVVVVPVPVAAPAPAPAPQPAPTCRETLLAQGHDSFDLSYCDGVNERCAVTLLETGHDPFDLSYCGGIRDVDCAVNLLRRGGDPFDLSDCN